MSSYNGEMECPDLNGQGREREKEEQLVVVVRIYICAFECVFECEFRLCVSAIRGHKVREEVTGGRSCRCA